MYANYEFYTESYGGKSIAAGDFPRLAAIASALIDKLTFGRAAEHSDDELVKMCCCELCEGDPVKGTLSARISGSAYKSRRQ